MTMEHALSKVSNENYYLVLLIHRVVYRNSYVICPITYVEFLHKFLFS